MHPRVLVTAALALFVSSSPGAVAQETPSSGERTRLFSDSNTSVVGPAVLSPDGKWIVFPVMETPSKSHLSVTRVAGGDTRRVTSTGSWDLNPEWSPAGDRIYFVSNRPAAAGDNRNYYGMELRFDPVTGHAVGEPRQVTTDAVTAFLRVSPDGRSLAFVDGTDRRLLKVMAVSGGESRVVARLPARSGNIAWSRDGQHLYFITNVALQSQRVLHRVPVAGGEVVAVGELPAQGQLLVGPGAEIFLVQENGDGPRDRLFKLYNQRGTLLRTIKTNRNTRATQVTADGRGIVAVEADVVAPTRIVAIAGGAHRDVTAPVTYDWVMRWSDDGKTLYTWTEQDGTGVLAAVPVDGGASARTFPETPAWGAQGANSRYLFQASRRDGASPRSLVALDLRDGSRHTISASAPGHNMIFPYGPGGTWAAHEELYFLERRGDWLDVKAWRGPGASRTLHSLPVSLLGRTNFAVHGNRVAWQQERGDSVDLMIAEGKNAKHRRLLSMPAMQGTNEISFSNDGRLLALHYSRGPGSPDLMALVDPRGNKAPRVIDTGLSYWYWPRWLPDNSGVLVVGGGAGAEAHIVRIPVAEGAAPVNITRNDPASKWGFEVSPDGRYIAYPAEIWKGSSVWRLDLGDRGR